MPHVSHVSANQEKLSVSDGFVSEEEKAFFDGSTGRGKHVKLFDI